MALFISRTYIRSYDLDLDAYDLDTLKMHLRDKMEFVGQGISQLELNSQKDKSQADAT